MSTSSSSDHRLGVRLAERLGLNVPRREGHDLAGPCVACKSSDAFHIHQDSGVAHCFSCGGKWSPFQLAETVLGDRERAKDIMVDLGLFQAQPSVNGQAKSNSPPDPVGDIARQKGVTRESLLVYGAKPIAPDLIHFPCYGPDGKRCTTFSISTKGGKAGKGLFSSGKPAGLFFPHVDGNVRLPQPGETWHLVEGPKDAAALHGLGLFTCGMNTCRLAAKFARLFHGVDVILVPDRDRAGEDGSQHSARVLRGVVTSVRIAVLPCEFKESGGEDVRDVLRRSDGREQVLQSIADAKPPAGWEAKAEAAEAEAPAVALVEIAMPEGEPIKLEVSPCGGKPQRLVVATRGELEHRDPFAFAATPWLVTSSFKTAVGLRSRRLVVQIHSAEDVVNTVDGENEPRLPVAGQPAVVKLRPCAHSERGDATRGGPIVTPPCGSSVSRGRRAGSCSRSRSTVWKMARQRFCVCTFCERAIRCRALDEAVPDESAGRVDR